MNEKRAVKKNIKRIERIKTWQLVVLLVLSLFVSATLLRLNNVGMIERREAVYQADKAGEDYTTGDRLYDLQRYASEHMNASTGDVYLDKKYLRDLERITKEAEAANQASGDKSAELLREAYEVCRDRYPGYSLAYTQCVGAEQDKIPANAIGVTKAEFPPASLYKHSFISPLWSFDFAGIAVLASALLVVLIIARLLVASFLRWRLHRLYRSTE